MQNILSNDINYTFSKLSDDERARLKDATVLITGCAGFLGYYFMHFFDQKADELGIRKIIGLDNFMLGYPEWVKKLEQSPKVNIQKFDIIRDNIAGVQYAGEADYIIHLASVASPMFYRKYPIETLDANICYARLENMLSGREDMNYEIRKSMTDYFLSRPELVSESSTEAEIFNGFVATWLGIFRNGEIQLSFNNDGIYAGDIEVLLKADGTKEIKYDNYHNHEKQCDNL